jgi:hypothetical protein
MASEDLTESSDNKLPRRTAGLKKILFFTSSEYGQANVILAVAYELLLRRKYDIQIVSFAPLKNRIKDLNNLASSEHSDPAIFHTVLTLSMMEAIRSKGSIGPYPPGVSGALKTYRITLPAMATAWDGPDYMAGYEFCLERIRSINPDNIIIDPLFDQGLQACKTALRNYVVLSPNTFHEILRKQQPFLHQLCRYPAYIHPHFLTFSILLTSPQHIFWISLSGTMVIGPCQHLSQNQHLTHPHHLTSNERIDEIQEISKSTPNPASFRFVAKGKSLPRTFHS